MLTWLIEGAALLLVVWFLFNRMVLARGIKTLSTSELKGLLKAKNIQFIDVRTPAEFKANHIHEFKNMPLHVLEQQAQKLSKEKEVVVICQSGMRSSQAAKRLKKMGFEHVTNVTGGMSAW